MYDTLSIYHDLIEGIVAAIEARDSYTASHSQRVSEIAQQLCSILQLEGAETIHIAAHLHDIGKIGVPDAILQKPSALSPEEWALMKDHAEIGYQILSKISGFEEVAKIVRHHHERWDGKGYPMGLSAVEIPIGSRVIALADSIDAMLSKRNYRMAMSFAQCKQEIEKNAGVMYDPKLVQAVMEHWVVIESLYTSSRAASIPPQGTCPEQ